MKSYIIQKTISRINYLSRNVTGGGKSILQQLNRIDPNEFPISESQRLLQSPFKIEGNYPHPIFNRYCQTIYFSHQAVCYSDDTAKKYFAMLNKMLDKKPDEATSQFIIDQLVQRTNDDNEESPTIANIIAHSRSWDIQKDYFNLIKKALKQCRQPDIKQIRQLLSIDGDVYMGEKLIDHPDDDNQKAALSSYFELANTITAKTSEGQDLLRINNKKSTLINYIARHAKKHSTDYDMLTNYLNHLFSLLSQSSADINQIRQICQMPDHDGKNKTLGSILLEQNSHLLSDYLQLLNQLKQQYYKIKGININPLRDSNIDIDDIKQKQPNSPYFYPSLFEVDANDSSKNDDQFEAMSDSSTPIKGNSPCDDASNNADYQAMSKRFDELFLTTNKDTFTKFITTLSDKRSKNKLNDEQVYEFLTSQSPQNGSIIQNILSNPKQVNTFLGLLRQLKPEKTYNILSITDKDQQTLGHKICDQCNKDTINQYFDVLNYLDPNQIKSILEKQDSDRWLIGHKIAFKENRENCINNYFKLLNRLTPEQNLELLKVQGVKDFNWTIGHFITHFQNQEAIQTYLAKLNNLLKQPEVDNNEIGSLLTQEPTQGSSLSEKLLIFRNPREQRDPNKALNKDGFLQVMKSYTELVFKLPKKACKSVINHIYDFAGSLYLQISNNHKKNELKNKLGETSKLYQLYNKGMKLLGFGRKSTIQNILKFNEPIASQPQVSLANHPNKLEKENQPNPTSASSAKTPHLPR